MEDLDNIKRLMKSLKVETEEFSSQLESTILEKTLNELLVDISINGEDKVGESQIQLDKAKLLNSYAYVLSSLYFVFLKISGLNKDNTHPIMQELNRVKSYVKRVKTAEDFLNKDEKQFEVDTETAKRIIRNQLEPAVSKVHFEGKHTKFDENSKKIKEKLKGKTIRKVKVKKDRNKITK